MKNKILYLIFALFLVLTFTPSSASAADKSIVYPRTKLKDVTVKGAAFLYAPQGNMVWTKNHMFFTDKSGNLGLFSYKDGNKPTVYIFDKDYNVVSTLVLNLPSHDILGTFTLASDGDYYVVLGHNNTKEDAKKTVVSLLKVSAKTGEVIKKGELKAKQFGTQLSSIRRPFIAGTADLVESSGKIYIHMAYEMFTASDGKNHQAANLFVFDGSSLKPTEVKQKFYVSHSFNQMIKLDGSTIVTLSHGDANPRAIRLATLDSKGNYNQTDLFTIKGKSGLNATGTTISGFEISSNYYLVTGRSVTHNNPVNGKYSPSGEWHKGQNIYLSVVNKSSMGTKHIWLTTFDPENTDTRLTDPRIFKIGSSFIVVYSVSQNDKSYTEFVTIDKNGKVLARNKKDNTAFYSNAYPIVYNNKFIWISPYAVDMEYSYAGANTKIDKYKFEDTNRVYLFEVDISNPKSPKWIEGIRPTSVVFTQSSVALDWGDTTKITAKVLPANSPFDDLVLAPSSSLSYSVTSDGYVTALSPSGGSGKIFAMCVIDGSIYSTVPVTSSTKLKVPATKSTVSTPKNKQVGLYSTYESYLLEMGRQTKSITLMNGSSAAAEYYLTSSDESIVKIKDSTTVVSVSSGIATVYFHTKDKQKVASCEVIVTPSRTDGVYIIQKPKTSFALKEGFDTTNFIGAVVSNSGKKIAFYNDKQVAFCVSDLQGITNVDIWGRGRPLTKSGKIKIRVLVGGKEVSYTIDVGSSSVGADNSTYSIVLEDGRYNLRCMYNYISIASDGGAVFKSVAPNPVFDVKNQTDGTYTIQTESGKYLGISGTIVDGIQLKEVDSPYYWKLYSENNSDIFSISPASNTKMVVNAAGQKKTDGTWIILWTYEDTNAPNHAEFRFIPVK